MRSVEKPSALSLRPDPGWALFLDVDGTVLHLKETPDAVERSDRVCRILDELLPRLGGAVALVSGRPIDELDELFRPRRLPAAGQHGLERRDARGRRRAAPAPPGLDRLRASLKASAAGAPGVIVEEKSHALAVHYRQAPGIGDALRDAVRNLVREHAPDMQVMHGHMVIEIKPAGADKGSAIRDFMAETPFRGRVPVFIGDDTTDEDGFAHVNAAGGLSVRVGRSDRTAAGHVLSDVDEVVEWLGGWPARLGAPSRKREDAHEHQP